MEGTGTCLDVATCVCSQVMSEDCHTSQQELENKTLPEKQRTHPPTAGAPQPGGRFELPTCSEYSYTAKQESSMMLLSLRPGSTTVETGIHLRAFPEYPSYEAEEFVLCEEAVATLMRRLAGEGESYMRVVHLRHTPHTASTQPGSTCN